MPNPSRMPVLLFVTAGLCLNSLVRAQEGTFAEESRTGSVQAVSASTAYLESEVAEIKSRMNAMDRAGAVQRSYAEITEAVCPGWLVSVDYLYWDLHRRGSDFALTTDDSALAVGRGAVHHLEMDRDSGFRLNAGYRFATGWELAAGYTYFATSASAAAAEPAGGNMWATRSHPNDNEEAATADAAGSFDYNVFDLEARSPWLQSCPVALRWFGGLRWSDVEQDFQAAYDGYDFDDSVYRNRTNMTGFGLRLGAESQWRWNANWSLFGSAAGSVLYGRFHTQMLETNVGGADTIVDVRDDYRQAVPVLEAAVGVAWNRGPVQIRAGYEMANWFNLADRSLFPDDVHEGAYAPLAEDVLLEGLFLRLAYSL
jgi:hypothetical protein